MGVAVLDRPLYPAAFRAASRPVDGGPTLESVIVGAWEGLTQHREVGCPVCGGRLAPRYGASGVTPVGGRCSDCGCVLG